MQDGTALFIKPAPWVKGIGRKQKSDISVARNERSEPEGGPAPER